MCTNTVYGVTNTQGSSNIVNKIENYVYARSITPRATSVPADGATITCDYESYRNPVYTSTATGTSESVTSYVGYNTSKREAVTSSSGGITITIPENPSTSTRTITFGISSSSTVGSA